MIIWNLNPVALSFGALQVRWYGLVYALGFLLGYFVLLQAAKQHRIKNLTVRGAEDYIVWLMIGGVVGGRLGEVLFFDPSYYWHNPLEIPAVWHGGMSIQGGLIGAILITIWWCRKHKVVFYQIADVLVVPLALVLVFGRLANYVNGELWGKPTSVPWCVMFPGVDGCRHPSQIYEALYSYVLFFVLLVLQEWKRWRDGVVFWSFILLYGMFRFAENFYRALDTGDPGYGGLGMGQWLGLIMIVAAVSWFVVLRYRGQSLVRAAR